MISRVENLIEWGFDHFVVVALSLALFILTLISSVDAYTISVVAVLLCAVGLTQKDIFADPWIVFPFIVYSLAGMVSSYVVYGDITQGYSFLHMIFPIVYLLTVCMDNKELFCLKRLCVLWAGFVAAYGIIKSVQGAVIRGGGRRLRGLLGGANAMGIFLVLSWFVLLDLEQDQEMPSGLRTCFIYIEPVLLIALAMTLSMGSFVAMAVGILWYLMEKGKQCSGKDTCRCACMMLARASLCFGIGLLLYLATSWTGVPISSVPIFLYAVAVVVCWPEFRSFLDAYPHMSVLIAGGGILAAVVCIVIRPSAIDTFTERLEMMRNGLGYLGRNPLLGVGQYRWRVLNLYDSDKYFNVWYIHNTLLHVGVESGWIAMGMLLIIVVRVLQKKGRTSKAGFLAFCFHNLLDIAFFFPGLTAFTIITAADPTGRRKISGFIVKIFFVLTAIMFAQNLYSCMLGG